LSFILRHCGVLVVRLTPQDSLALILSRGNAGNFAIPIMIIGDINNL